MRTGHYLALAGLALLPLSACSTYSLQELRQTTPQGTPFQQALAQRYLDFSTRQEKAYDWFNSIHFADKGLMSAYGKDVAPEDPKEWDIPPEARPALMEARAQLLAALTPETEARQPELAAEAQSDFDCWVIYQEPNWQQGKITQCHDGFNEALAQLAVDAAPASPPHTTKPEAVRKSAAPVPVKKETYLVFFEPNHSDLTEQGKQIIDGVAQALSNQSGYELVLGGHTDTVGSQEYNLKLSQRRAQSVKNRLLDDGLEETLIKLFAFGKSDPLVKSGDQMAEPKNRRVEIHLEDHK